MENTQTLHETLSENFEKIVEAPAEVVTDTPIEKAQPEKVADRPRDETGKFVKSEAKVDKTEVKDKPVVEAKVVEAKPVYTPPKRPSTWKPELEDHWGKLPKEIHEEIARREADYSRGVSTYKAEYDRLKVIQDALNPHLPVMQQLNMKPEEFVSSLARTDQTLRFGNEEQKLAAFAQFAQDYQIPLHKLLTQGEDGKVYFNQQYFQPQGQRQNAPGLTTQDVDKIVNERMQQVAWQNAISTFSQAKDKSGNPLYPHFENQEVRKSMDGLLRAGLAKDLPSAYEAALKLPQHSDIHAAIAEQQRAAEEAEKQRKAAEDAKRARAQTVSVRSQAPTALVTDSSKKGKGLRELLSEGLDEQSGRV